MEQPTLVTIAIMLFLFFFDVDEENKLKREKSGKSEVRRTHGQSHNLVSERSLGDQEYYSIEPLRRVLLHLFEP